MSRGEMNISRAFAIAQNIANKNEDDEKNNKNNSKRSKIEDNKNIKDKEKNNKEKNKKKKTPIEGGCVFSTRNSVGIK